MVSEKDQSVFRKFVKKIKAHLVTDVPIELDACEDCRVTECSHGKLVDCENRIARVKQIEALQKREYGDSN